MLGRVTLASRRGSRARLVSTCSVVVFSVSPPTCPCQEPSSIAESRAFTPLPAAGLVAPTLTRFRRINEHRYLMLYMLQITKHNIKIIIVLYAILMYISVTFYNIL